MPPGKESAQERQWKSQIGSGGPCECYFKRGHKGSAMVCSVENNAGAEKAKKGGVRNAPDQI